MQAVIKPKMHIVIVGAGGVGGWFGGLFIHKGYTVTLVARGAHGDALRHNGLTLRGDDAPPIRHHAVTVVSSPRDVTDPADVILLTTKLGDLAEVSATLPSCLHEGSLIIPLQNGIDAHDIVIGALPPHHHDCVGWGTVHIVSYVEEPGVIYRKGTLARFFYQAPVARAFKADTIQRAWHNDDLPIRQHDDVTTMMWDKFIFLTAFSGVTTAAQKSIGAIRDDDALWQLFCAAMNETAAIAAAMGIASVASSSDEWQKRIAAFPPDYDSSMARDARLGRPLELEWLSARVVQLGHQHGIATPAHDSICEEVRKVTLAFS